MRDHLAILTTHPIQYQAAWFRGLAAQPGVDLQVFFCHQATPQEQAGAGFGVAFAWDVPLLEGYAYRFLRNVAKQPSIAGFRGLDTPEIGAIIARGQYDGVIVSGWNYLSAWQAFLACRRSRTPLLVRGDSQLTTPRHLLKRLLKEAAYRAFIPRFQACLAVGARSRAYYLHYGAPRERVFLVPHVVDERWFTPTAADGPDEAARRARWGLAEQATVFAFVGKFIPKKRPLAFVQAIAAAARAGAPVQGLMVGDGPLRPACAALVAASGAPVYFAGFLNQSQIAAAYRAVDALVLPSDGGETWGLVVNEAMTCGRPCFVSDAVGAGPDLVVPGETGATFPLDDVPALTALLRRYGADRPALAGMGARARARVARYGLPAAVRGTLQALAAVKQAHAA